MDEHEDERGTVYVDYRVEGWVIVLCKDQPIERETEHNYEAHCHLIQSDFRKADD